VWLPFVVLVAMFLAVAIPAAANAATPQQKRITALQKQVRTQQATIRKQAARVRTLTAERDRNLAALGRPGLFELVWSVRYLLNDGEVYTSTLFDSDVYRSVSFSWSKPF
jgi:hypothetical protein